MKYAIVKAFGHQYKVKEGDLIQTDRVPQEEGSSISFSDVLLVAEGENVKIGKPLVSGAKVTAKLEKHTRGKKVLVYKYLRKNKSQKRYGHKQPYSLLKIEKIEG